ncbi:MAG: hypothetical protein ACRD96_17135, partial [Bryobacteraceae bacterium]
GLYEVAGRMSGVDLGLPNPAAGNRPGALVFVDDLGRRGFQDRYWKQFSPRFGFAYVLRPRIVMRGGYGINNTPPISNGFGFGGTLGYSANIVLNTLTVPLTFVDDPVFFLHQRYPDFTATLPNKNPALGNNQGANYTARDSNRLAYVQNYNLGFQIEAPGRTVVEISYLGSKGTRLEANGLDQLDQLPVSALSLGDRLIEPLSQNPTLAPLPYAGFTGTVAQALRKYPQYLGVTQQFANLGTSTYNSLQLLMSRRFTSGLGYNVAYTWSKAMALADSAIDAISSQDVYNRGLEKSVTAYHVPHYLKTSWIYELPIGPGKALNLDGLAGKLIGGWTLTAVQNYRSGDQLQITTSGFRTDGIFNGTIRPDWVSSNIVVDKGEPVVFGTGGATQYLSPTAFAQIPRTSGQIPLRLGTAPRYLPTARGPIRMSEDFGFGKKFVFNENTSIEVRADMFNVFNRAGRGNPNTDITNPQFGKITGAAYGPRSIQMAGRITF